jgi:hypothetical protein
MNCKVLMKCLKIAKELNNETNSDTRHFSFLVRKNSINSVGYNYITKTHPIAFKLGYKWPTQHSELSAILNFSGKEISDYYMINFRFDKMGNLALSKPCKGCQRLLRYYNIGKVVYSTGCGFKIWS